VLIGVIIPTLNAAANWPKLVPPLLMSVAPERVLIMDSASSDGTVSLARAAGFRVCSFPQKEFNHGGTRQLAAELLGDAEIVVYLTQDAILHDPSSLGHLLAAFADPSVAAAFGRQLPRFGAGPIESHARGFNYPATSDVRDLDSRDRLGIKTIFMSNSFAAYRRSALMAVGGFPGDIIFGEDTVTAGKLLLKGWRIAYVAEASVHHSHAYSWRQEFKRYFDIGVLHTRESWLQENFGRTGGEGKRFVISELTHLWHNRPILIPSAMIRTMLKLAGYRLGRLEQSFSPNLKRKLSMHHTFWRGPEDLSRASNKTS